MQNYGVDPAAGLGGGTPALTTLSYYDSDGRVVAVSSPGGAWNKVVYDSVGRPVVKYVTDGAGTDPTKVTGDTVYTQQEMQYDAGGNVLLTTTRDRAHDATGAGPLGDKDGTGGPAARVSYVAAYYDAANRPVAVADFGTYGGQAFTRPALAQLSSQTALVTYSYYDEGGWLRRTDDPRGTSARWFNDALGRPTKVFENFVATQPNAPPPPGADKNRETDYAYDALGHKKQVTVKDVKANAGGTTTVTDKTTFYLYGIGGDPQNGGSSFWSNDVMSEVRYPGFSPQTAIANQEFYRYDAQGEVTYHKDRNGTGHAFEYDGMGRQTAETLDVPGNKSITRDVTRRTTRYDSAGRPSLFTSQAPGGGGWATKNQVKRPTTGSATSSPRPRNTPGP